MAQGIILLNITCVSFFLLAFIAFFNPLRVNVIANRWFALFMFAAGSAVLDVIIDKVGVSNQYRQLVAFNELSRFAMMPALYLSVLHYTSPDKVFKKREYLHLLPFFIFFICAASFVVGQRELLFNPEAIPAVIKMGFEIIIKLSIPVQLVVYWLLAYRKLINHQQNIELVTSNTSPVNLNWLKLLLFGVLAMIVINLVDRIYANEFMVEYAPLGYLVCILFVAYFFIGQKEIYPYQESELKSISEIINQKPKDVSIKQRFSENTLMQLKVRLIDLMENERVFLDNELGLPELAQEMNISSHDLSYLLNEGFGVNFFQFINSYRVEEAKQLMLSEKYRHLNILGIAYNAGFNSKTTFNTAFKKETGLSPSQFIQGAKADSSAEVTL